MKTTLLRYLVFHYQAQSRMNKWGKILSKVVQKINPRLSKSQVTILDI